MRPVYVSGGAARSACGAGLDALCRGVMAADPHPARVVFQSLGRSIDLPYQRSPIALTTDSATALAAEALSEAGLDDRRDPRLGLFLGTSSGGIGQHEQAFIRAHAQHPDALAILQPDQSKPTVALHAALGLRGPHYTVSTACSSAGNALLYASWAIREGWLDHALVVGLELENRLSQQGFFALMLATREACRPFDTRRDGIVLGEGIGVVVLSARRPARGPAWQLRGGATLCDTTHPTNPSAGMIAETLRRACADAAVPTDAITAIKVHGTGTRANDETEGLGLLEVFGDRMPPLTSLKPALGHTLGACGALETLAFRACLDQGFVPPTAGFEEPDPALALQLLREPLPWHGGPVLLNTFGFGGNNCALVLQRTADIAPC